MGLCGGCLSFSVFVSLTLYSALYTILSTLLISPFLPSPLASHYTLSHCRDTAGNTPLLPPHSSHCTQRIEVDRAVHLLEKQNADKVEYGNFDTA